MNNAFYKLMLVTNCKTSPVDSYLNFIKQCAQSGITSVQLREKEQKYDYLLAFGRQLASILAPFNIPLIINDNINLALELNAAGVHLGQTDGDPVIARKLLGPDKIIGVSIDSAENLHHANAAPINYVGIGAIFPTMNKQNVITTWGIAGLKELAPQSKHPIIGIGGIHTGNAKEVISSGAAGIAVIDALHHAHDAKLTAQQLRHIIDTGDLSHAG